MWNEVLSTDGEIGESRPLALERGGENVIELELRLRLNSLATGPGPSGLVMASSALWPLKSRLCRRQWPAGGGREKPMLLYELGGTIAARIRVENGESSRADDSDTVFILRGRTDARGPSALEGRAAGRA